MNFHKQLAKDLKAKATQEPVEARKRLLEYLADEERIQGEDGESDWEVVEIEVGGER